MRTRFVVDPRLAGREVDIRVEYGRRRDVNVRRGAVTL